MRKVNKRKAFLAELLALTMLLCSFHVITAEAMDTDFVPAEETVTTELVPEETAGIDQEPAPAEEPAEEPEEEPEAGQEPEPETEPEEEPAEKPEDGREAEPAEEPAEKPEDGQESEPETEPEEEPEEEPEAGQEPEPEINPESESESESKPEGDTAEDEPAAAPESPEAPADQPEEEPDPDKEEDPVQEDAEDEPEEESADESEDDLYEFDDDDAGYVSDELLEMYNSLAEEQKAEFTGTVDIELKDVEIAFGRNVTLIARVIGADTLNYRLIWEANDGNDHGWYVVGAGSEYTFLLTRENAEREYRVLLFAVD